MTLCLAEVNVEGVKGNSRFWSHQVEQMRGRTEVVVESGAFAQDMQGCDGVGHLDGEVCDDERRQLGSFNRPVQIVMWCRRILDPVLDYVCRKGGMWRGEEERAKGFRVVQLHKLTNPSRTVSDLGSNGVSSIIRAYVWEKLLHDQNQLSEMRRESNQRFETRLRYRDIPEDQGPQRQGWSLPSLTIPRVDPRRREPRFQQHATSGRLRIDIQSLQERAALQDVQH